MLKVPAVTVVLFYSEPPLAHPVVEPHAWSHAIVELTNDRDHILWYGKTASTGPGEGSTNRVVRFISQAHTYLYFLLATPRVPLLFTI